MKLTTKEFEALVEESLREVPPMFAKFLEEVAIEIEQVPDRRTCLEAGIDDSTELLGYYQGTPLTERSVEQDLRLPDRITIYQRNLERFCETREEMIEEVRITVLHEIGHHFGLDEDELEELGYA